MVALWRAFKRSSKKPYDFQRLIDSVLFETIPQRAGCTHIICDIDKTYLETEFESVLKMARIAVEPASKKITVRGASDVLVAARWPIFPKDEHRHLDLPRPLHFVSSSPPQLRLRLEEKLSLDGLDWSSDTFKNQVYNVLKGRMDLLKQHIAYKSAAILQLLKISGKDANFILIGDTAESDAYIFTGIALFLQKILSPVGYGEYLKIAGIEERTASDIVKKFSQTPEAKVAGILIRNAPGYTFVDHPTLTKPIAIFDNFLQAALILMNMKMIPPSMLWWLVRQFHNQHGFSRAEIISLLTELELNTELKNEVDKVKAKLLAVKPAPKQNHNKLRISPPDFSNFQDMKESDALLFARQWVEKMHSRPK